MNTNPSAPVTPRVTDTPTLGARVVGRRGGDLPGLAATLRVAELPNLRNGQLVLVYDDEGNGRYLHPSLAHEGRWRLGSREVAFAPGEPDAVATTVPPTSPREPVLWVRPDATGSSPGAPELHIGTEHQGLSGVWVVCGCGFATTRQDRLLKVSRAWDEHNGHALAALREAVTIAWDTRQVSDTTGPEVQA